MTSLVKERTKDLVVVALAEAGGEKALIVRVTRRLTRCTKGKGLVKGQKNEHRQGESGYLPRLKVNRTESSSDRMLSERETGKETSWAV